MIFNKWNDSCILQPLPVTSAQWFSGVTHTIHAAAVKALTSYSREGGHVYTVLKILAAQKFLLEDFFVSLNKHVLTSAISCRRHSPLVILAKTAGEKKKSFFFLYLLEQFLKTNQLQNLSPNCTHLKILLAISLFPSSKLFCLWCEQFCSTWSALQGTVPPLVATLAVSTSARDPPQSQLLPSSYQVMIYSTSSFFTQNLVYCEYYIH